MIVERSERNAKRPPRAHGNNDRASRTTREWLAVTSLFTF